MYDVREIKFCRSFHITYLCKVLVLTHSVWGAKLSLHLPSSYMSIALMALSSVQHNLTGHLLRRLERVFTLRGDWFQIDAIPITVLGEIERNEMCKFTIKLS